MFNRSVVSWFCFVTLALAGCSSSDMSGYDALNSAGKVESTARKTYKSFFQMVQKLDAMALENDTALDSTMVSRAELEADSVAARMKDFPNTVTSRIAFDALSYAAASITVSPHIKNPELRLFWENYLVAPLFFTGQAFMENGGQSDAAQLQVLKGIQRAMGANATQEMLGGAMPILGLTPSDEAMKFCETDTLVFKRIHDLLLYSRSLQQVDPPIWLLSGNWFLAFQFDKEPPFFIVLAPHIASDLAFIAFKDVTAGDVYAAVFDDPVPKDKEKWDTWLTRAGAVMKDLTFDNSFAAQVKRSSLKTMDAYYVFDDYLVSTSADSVRKEIYISFTRQRIRDNKNFDYAGRDSLTVVFKDDQIIQPDGSVTTVVARRNTDSSMVGGKLYPQKSYTGNAYLMMIGEHHPEIAQSYRDLLMEKISKPRVTISTEAPTGPVNIPGK
jgi:hypothetical protein